jgi:hypothetical protein
MRSFRSFCFAGLLLSAAGCNSTPAPGTVLSSQVFPLPPDASVAQACTELCVAQGGDCVGFECQAQTTSDGGPGLLCEKTECGPPPTGHE